MIVDPEKSQLMILQRSGNSGAHPIDGNNIKATKSLGLLGIPI